MVDFVEQRFNDGLIIYNTVGGPTFSTNVVITFSGHEQRNVNWQQARGRWELGERLCTQAELNDIVRFFRAVLGRATGFRFKDWADFAALATEGVLGTGVGTGATVYDLNKKYLQGTLLVYRRVFKPVAATVQVFKNLVLLTTPGQYTLDSTTGKVTLVSPATGVDTLTWAGEFDVPVRFDTEELKSRFDVFDVALNEKLHYLQTLPIVELRL